MSPSIIDQTENTSTYIMRVCIDMAGGSTISCPPCCYIFSGRRLRTLTVESEAFVSCSELLQLDTAESCEVKRKRCRSREPQDENDLLCLEYGELTLPYLGNSGVCWATGCPRSLFAGCRHDVPFPHRDFSLVRGTFPQRLRDLSTILHLNFTYFKSHRTLYDFLPSDLVDTSASWSTELETSKCNIWGPDLSASIGVFVFFRLLGSLQRKKNVHGILKLIKQVPSMIADTSVLSLKPRFPTREYPPELSSTAGLATALGGLTAEASMGGVVEAIISAAEELLSKHKLCTEQQGEILETLIGLSVKRGSLANCLRVVKLLVFSAINGGIAPIPGVGHHLKVYFRRIVLDIKD